MPEDKQESVVSYLEPIEEGDISFAPKKEMPSSAIENETERPSSNEAAYEKILSTVSRERESSVDEAAIDQDASKISEYADIDSQIQRLVDMAQTQGVAHTVRVAQKLESFYILDGVHDRLDRLYKTLQDRGMLEK